MGWAFVKVSESSRLEGGVRFGVALLAMLAAGSVLAVCLGMTGDYAILPGAIGVCIPMSYWALSRRRAPRS